VRQCWRAFHELRPHLQSEDEFVKNWRKLVEEGYQIVYVKEGEKVVAAAGYRFLNTMAWGHILYIDDLVALQTSQRTGLGTLLLQPCRARREGKAATPHIWIPAINVILPTGRIFETAFILTAII
jgi:hypothetical protein